jgi:hypothetical protein
MVKHKFTSSNKIFENDSIIIEITGYKGKYIKKGKTLTKSAYRHVEYL